MRFLREDLLEDIRDGVSIALEKGGLESVGYVDDIKLNKLAYFAIRDHNLPITYGWYKYGPAPYEAAGGGVQTIPARGLDDFEAPEEPRVPTVDNTFLSPREYSLYFLNERADDFEEVVRSDTKEYLVSFYDEYASDEYRELYKASARLQQELDWIKEDENWVNESAETYSRVKEFLWDLNEEMLRTEPVEEAVAPVRKYSGLVEDLILGVEERGAISPAQQRFIGTVVEFFYGGAWEYAALLISDNTVVGPEKPKLKSHIEDDIQRKRESYDDNFEELKQRSIAFDLFPDHVLERREIENDDNRIPPSIPERDGMEPWLEHAGEVVANDESK